MKLLRFLMATPCLDSHALALYAGEPAERLAVAFGVSERAITLGFMRVSKVCLEIPRVFGELSRRVGRFDGRGAASWTWR